MIKVLVPAQLVEAVTGAEAMAWNLENVAHGVQGEWQGADLLLHFGDEQEAERFKERWLGPR